MRVLIQDVGSRLYYAGDQRWVAAEAQALDLAGAELATEQVLKLAGLRIVLNYDSHGLRSLFGVAGRESRGLAAFRGPVPDWRPSHRSRHTAHACRRRKAPLVPCRPGH